jgi:FixJ family two-component response regulator
MGLAEITVKIHRSNGTRKLGARSLADLLKMAQALGIAGERAEQ